MSEITQESDTVRQALLDLGIPTHKVGFEQLHMAIVRFSQDKMQSLSKEVYPYVAQALGRSDGRAVEHTIRDAIKYAWIRRDTAVWSRYFPGYRRSPSNKRFIATLAEYV